MFRLKSLLRRWIDRKLMEAVTPDVPIHVLPGGFKPEIGYSGDAAIDLPIRAIVSEKFVGEPSPRRRVTIWNFDNHQPFLEDGARIINPDHIFHDPNLGKFAYQLMPGESIPVGLGVVVEIPPGYVGFVVPRGSTVRALVRQSRLEIANSDVPIDPGFESEIWAEIVNHGPQPVSIFKGMRLCQLLVHVVAKNFVVKFNRREVSVLSHNGHRAPAAAHGSTGLGS